MIIEERLQKECLTNLALEAGKVVDVAGRLIFKLGGLSELELDKLVQEAASLGKNSSACAFYMERLRDERERSCTRTVKHHSHVGLVWWPGG